MPIGRYFINFLLENNASLSIKEGEFHHMVHVMRQTAGENVKLINGKGQLGLGLIDSIDKHQANISINEIRQRSPSTKKINIIQAMPKFNRLSFILEKGCELGMDKLILFPAAKSEIKEISENRLNRMKASMISAMKQCGSLYLPEIDIIGPISSWKTFQNPTYLADLHPDAKPLLPLYQSLEDKSEVNICIGPEGGFTEKERNSMLQLDIKSVTLHSNVLRTETASLVILSILKHFHLPL